MSVLTDAVPGLRDPEAVAADRDAESRRRVQALLDRAAPLAEGWAGTYNTAWALEEHIRRDARAWSGQTARDVVRHLRAPNTSLALLAAAVLGVGAVNLVTTLVLVRQVGALPAVLLSASGVLLSALGLQMAVRYAGILAQHRAGIPPLRARLEKELEREAIAALDRRRERLAGPRRPIPRHTFSELLPAHAHNIAAGWMRHLGELDATVLKPDELDDRPPMLQSEQAHVISSGYVGRVWSFVAQTPELELGLLEDAAAATGRRPVLFSRSGFSEPMIARANRRRIGLFTFEPWNGTLVAWGGEGERYLKRGLRDADGMTT